MQKGTRANMGIDRPAPGGFELELRDRVPETTPVQVLAVHCSLGGLPVGGVEQRTDGADRKVSPAKHVSRPVPVVERGPELLLDGRSVAR